MRNGEGEVRGQSGEEERIGGLVEERIRKGGRSRRVICSNGDEKGRSDSYGRQIGRQWTRCACNTETKKETCSSVQQDLHAPDFKIL